MNNGRPVHFRDSQVLKWKRRWSSKHSHVFNHSPPNMTHGNCLHALHIIWSSVTVGVICFFFFSWILSFLQTLHTSWPSELAPSFTSASHSFPFFPTPLSLYVWNAPRHSDGSLEGLDLFVVAPLSHGEMAIREKRVTSQLFFCKFPHFHLCTNRRGVLLSPWRRGSARGFWICWLL